MCIYDPRTCTYHLGAAAAAAAAFSRPRSPFRLHGRGREAPPAQIFTYPSLHILWGSAGRQTDLPFRSAIRQTGISPRAPTKRQPRMFRANAASEVKRRKSGGFLGCLANVRARGQPGQSQQPSIQSHPSTYPSGFLRSSLRACIAQGSRTSAPANRDAKLISVYHVHRRSSM